MRTIIFLIILLLFSGFVTASYDYVRIARMVNYIGVGKVSVVSSTVTTTTLKNDDSKIFDVISYDVVLRIRESNKVTTSTLKTTTTTTIKDVFKGCCIKAECITDEKKCIENKLKLDCNLNKECELGGIGWQG